MAITYDKIWGKIIRPNLDQFRNIDGLTLNSTEVMKKSIKENYQEFYEHCLKNYMDDSVKTLDRHKVAACYMFAIIKADLFKSYPISQDKSKIIIIKEQVAISTGLSILRAYLVNKYDSYEKQKPADVLKMDRAIFNKDFVLPDEKKVNHGEYRNNFAMELYFTKEEKNYNILSLSNSLYLLEMYNRHIWQLNNPKQ